MQPLIQDLITILRPALKSVRQAEQRLDRYWADKIALIWKTADVHRAANEIEVVLTKQEARDILTELHTHHNYQYGLRWQDVTDLIRQQGVGRKLSKRELKGFLDHDLLTVDPPKQKGPQ